MQSKKYLLFPIAALVFAQTPGAIGIFEAESDVGKPALAGSCVYNAANKEYRLTGAGENMWAKADEFHFVWRKLSGNVRLTATMHFVGTSAAGHRKAGLMLRRSLDGDAPYVDAVVHGDGLTVLQVRETAGDITRGFRFPMSGPARIALERRGNVYSLWFARNGGPLHEAGSIQANLGNDLYAGLFICSHNPKTTESAVFSDVTVEPLPSAAGNGAKKK